MTTMDKAAFGALDDVYAEAVNGRRAALAALNRDGEGVLAAGSRLFAARIEEDRARAPLARRRLFFGVAGIVLVGVAAMYLLLTVWTSDLGLVSPMNLPVQIIFTGIIISTVWCAWTGIRDFLVSDGLSYMRHGHSESLGFWISQEAAQLMTAEPHAIIATDADGAQEIPYEIVHKVVVDQTRGGDEGDCTVAVVDEDDVLLASVPGVSREAAVAFRDKVEAHLRTASARVTEI